MKKLLILASLVAVGLWMAGLSMAGDYHQSATLVCSECHTMHGSMQHGFGGETGTGWPWTATTLRDNLLKDTEENLCLSCHNGSSSAPDVFEANTGSNVRQGGALNKTDTGTYKTWMGHTLGSTAAPPGLSGSWTNTGLVCSSCHEVHGIAAQYRNLRTNPGSGTGLNVTYVSGSTNTTTKDVWQNAAPPTGPGNFDAARYTWSNIKFNKPTSSASAYGAWCGGCHGNFHTDYTSANYRHPTRDKTLSGSMETRYESLTNKVQTLNADWGAANPTAYTPSCMSCHKAHGNAEEFGLIYMSGTGTVTEEGDGGQYRDLCRQCHTQGG